MQSLRLVYVWIEEYKHIQRQGLSCTLDYTVQHDEQRIKAERSTFRELNREQFRALDSFSAIVGKNGTGKSYFLNSIRQVLRNGKFPDEGTTGFMLFEQLNGKENPQLLMLKSKREHYRFDDGKVVEDLDLSTFQLVDYNPLRQSSAYSIVQHEPAPSGEIALAPAVLKGEQATIVMAAQRLASMKEELVESQALRSIKVNPHARFEMKYAHLVEPINLSQPFKVSDGSALSEPWMAVLGQYMVSKIYQAVPDIDSFVLSYGFRFWCELLKPYEKVVEENLTATLDEVALAFTMIDFVSGHREQFVPRHDANNAPVNTAVESAIAHFSQRDLDISQFYPAQTGQFSRKVDEIKSLAGYFKSIDQTSSHLTIPFSAHTDLTKVMMDVTYREDIHVGGNVIREPIGAQFIFDVLRVKGLSSGESQMLYFLGQLKACLTTSLSAPAVILMDEIEVAFHPEWQRHLIDVLLDLFAQVANDNKSFRRPQVVLATHSPFLLSDVLNGKTLTLDNVKGEKLETFGANIHDLLSRSFFMGRNVGERSAKVMMSCAEAIDELNLQYCAKQASQLKLIIEQLSDPMIKSQLSSRLDALAPPKSEIQLQLQALLNSALDDQQLIEKLSTFTRKD